MTRIELSSIIRENENHKKKNITRSRKYMKDEYVLYLDESELKKSKTFAIAGIAVKKDNVIMLEQGMNEVKKLIWSEEYIASSNPILHCTELEKVFSNRNSDDITGVKDEYHEFKKLRQKILKKYIIKFMANCRRF